ncbi:hypothetical protein PG994_002445 [Apiospora phragmitis]|uniref:Defect at low temperature protein 1 n=1 Tax=Apiospora phragmitis TaxID=2905665 RepID=A0ABR1WWD2_9PEZI
MAQSKAKLHTAFRIFYNSLYFLFQLILLALLLAVPGDIIRQAYLFTFQYSNIIIISGVYLVSVIIVLFVYFLRAVHHADRPGRHPAEHHPHRQGRCQEAGATDDCEGPREERRHRLGGATESYRPQRRTTRSRHRGGGGQRVRAAAKREGRREVAPIAVFLAHAQEVADGREQDGHRAARRKPVWGEIEHNGWGSPNSPDLPNLQYSTVLSELPHLIEAKAVSQAPADRYAAPDQPAFDPGAVAMLQRAVHMGLRDYVLHLTSLGVIPSTQTVSDFLDAYERGRFSPRPMSNAAFRNLMHLFAEVLRTMQPLAPSALNSAMSNDDDDRNGDMNSMYTDSHSNIDDDAPRESSPTTPEGGSIHSMASSSSLRTPVGRNTSSRQPLPQKRPAMVARNSSGTLGISWRQYGTAPTTPVSRAGRRSIIMTTAGGGGGRMRDVSQSSSTNSGNSNFFAQTRPPYAASSYGGGTGSDGSSLRRSASQQSGGSVIRLSRREDGVDLPYVLRIGESF